MANKRYYWLKLNENFFERTEVLAMLAQKNGSEIAVIYLRLMMMGINSDGLIEYEHIMPDLTSEIALKLHCNAAAVGTALGFFAFVGVAEVTEQSVKLLRMDDMAGSESESAEKMRKLRSKLCDNTEVTNDNTCDTIPSQCDNTKVTNCNTEVTNGNTSVTIPSQCDNTKVTNCNTEVTNDNTCNTIPSQCDLDIEKEKDIEKDTDIQTDIDTDRQTDKGSAGRRLADSS